MMKVSDRKKLWGRAGGRCSKCRADVTGEGAGAEAHIVAKAKNGPRANPDFPKDELHGYGNRILLCPSCHNGEVDVDTTTWTVERLLELKASHEAWVMGDGATEAVVHLDGTHVITARGAESVTGARIRKPTRFAPGTSIHVNALDSKIVTGIEVD